MFPWLATIVVESVVGWFVGKAMTRAAQVAAAGLTVAYGVAIANNTHKEKEPTPAEIQLKQLQP